MVLHLPVFWHTVPECFTVSSLVCITEDKWPFWAESWALTTTNRLLSRCPPYHVLLSLILKCLQSYVSVQKRKGKQQSAGLARCDEWDGSSRANASFIYLFFNSKIVWKCSTTPKQCTQKWIHTERERGRERQKERAGERQRHQQHNTACCTAAKIYTAYCSHHTTSSTAQNRLLYGRRGVIETRVR